MTVVALIIVDIVWLNKHKKSRISGREALFWTIAWFLLALIFNGFLWLYLAHTQTFNIANQKSLEFLTGYLIEKSLSIDNIFVIFMIFQYFSIPVQYQRRVLLYGVLGAIVLRLLFISLGVILVNQFYWILYVFGVFLIVTGVKMAVSRKKELSLPDSFLIRFLKKHCRMTETMHDEKFMIRQHGFYYLTPLFLALILIELSDVVFAADSIPAIFAITHDPFIIFTSNIFAVLGLRALYFFLAHLHEKFVYLKYGLAAILVLVGTKMLLEPWVHVSALWGLGVIVVVLLASMVMSVLLRHCE